MQAIKRKNQGQKAAFGGALLSFVGVFKLVEFYFRAAPTSGDALSTGAHYGSALDGLLWIIVGASVYLIAKRSQKLPAAEYDASELRIIRAKPIGQHQIVTIPIANITRFQTSEPGVTDVYFKKDNDETIENLMADAADLEQFQSFVTANRA